MNQLNSITAMKTKDFFSKYTSFVTFIGLVFILSILTQGRALSWDSLKILIMSETVRAFAALGVGMIIITRGIDLSIGFVVCLCASVAASFAQEATHAAAIYPGASFPLFVPVIAGIMPVTNAKQIKRICSLSGTALPSRFKAIIDRFADNPAAMKQAGIAYATEQIIDLTANGVNNIHVYTMNKPDIAKKIMDNLSEIISTK